MRSICGAMADSDQSKQQEQLQRVNFRCEACGGHRWQGEPVRIEDFPADPEHPWQYFSNCPVCGEERPQAYWERNLMKAHARATGPKTPEGVAAVTKNLAGHPTPEEARRTRFNALKIGHTAKTATFYPAAPGRYAECEGCEYREEICPQQVACLKKMELFMQVHAAFETRDPDALDEIHATIQGNFFAVLQDMFRRVIATGPELKSPAYYYDKKGDLHWVEKYDMDTGEVMPIYDYSAHPLLKVIGEWMSKNSISLDDLALTRKGKEDREVDMGYIEAEQESKDQIAGYLERQAIALEDFRDMAKRGQQRLREDPVLVEQKGGG